MKTHTLSSLLLFCLTSIGCTEAPVSLATTAGQRSEHAELISASAVQTLTATSTYTSGKNHIAFATDFAASWDDISITLGSTTITENFSDGSWNPANFQLDDGTQLGSVVDGAYRSTYPDRGSLRTVAEFVPSVGTPLIIEATLYPDQGPGALNFLMWRSDGKVDGEPTRSLFLRLHDWDAFTEVRASADGGSESITSNVDSDWINSRFFADGPVRVKVIDDGVDVTMTFTPLSAPTYASGGFLAPVSKSGRTLVTGGSTFPLKFQVTLDGVPVSDRSAINGDPEYSYSSSCAAASSVRLVGPTLATLQYLAGTRQFVLPWRVPRERGCYTVTIKLVGGETISADFEVRR